jgi:antitoxin FitA
MATLTVRNLPEEALAKFRVRAAENGRSMEAEARELLVAVADGGRIVPPPKTASLDERIASIHASIRERLGELPKGRVDAFIADRKAAAERGE